MHADTVPPPSAWPAHDHAVVPWRSRARVPRADRMLRVVRVAIPPRIAHLHWSPTRRRTRSLVARATDAVRRLDEEYGERLGAVDGFLVRTESVASSRIEHLDASGADIVRAAVGVRANPSATEMVRASAALRGLVRAAERGALTHADLLDAHRALMRDDPFDGPYAGRYRDVQNWIGGGASPRLARHVPPPPELVPELMDDLLAFLTREDLPPIVQAAIAHAQFESIHPFTDGNGRIGRALVGAVLRRRGLTTTVTIPLAAALAADRGGYFALLDGYRGGHVDGLVATFAAALGVACDESSLTALTLECLPDAWSRAPGVDAALLTTPRARLLLEALTVDPAVTRERAADLVGPDARAVLDALLAAGVIVPATDRVRDPVWIAGAVVAELDALLDRIAATADSRPMAA